jgi:hypothetical protein
MCPRQEHDRMMRYAQRQTTMIATRSHVKSVVRRDTGDGNRACQRLMCSASDSGVSTRASASIVSMPLSLRALC